MLHDAAPHAVAPKEPGEPLHAPTSRNKTQMMSASHWFSGEDAMPRVPRMPQPPNPRFPRGTKMPMSCAPPSFLGVGVLGGVSIIQCKISLGLGTRGTAVIRTRNV